MRIHLVTAESPESRRLRRSRLIQFPQLTMPLIAALTPPEHDVYHTDEIVERLDFDRPADLVGITTPTPSAPHAYAIADVFRRRRVPVVIGGPHATALPAGGSSPSIARATARASLFRRTVEFLEETSVDVATMSMVVPMPGTPTFRRWQAVGRILTTDWSKYDGKKHCVFEPSLMSPAELEAGTEWVARRFYSPRSIVYRLGRSRTGIWWNLSRNAGYMFANLLNA
jgi:radical SAM superfamily enzyme YgiQ (UPF0313 family)